MGGEGSFCGRGSRRSNSVSVGSVGTCLRNVRYRFWRVISDLTRPDLAVIGGEIFETCGKGGEMASAEDNVNYVNYDLYDTSGNVYSLRVSRKEAARFDIGMHRNLYLSMVKYTLYAFSSEMCLLQIPATVSEP